MAIELVGLAEVSGISKTERGERAARVTELLPLAAAYGVTADELVARSPPIPR